LLARIIASKEIDEEADFHPAHMNRAMRRNASRQLRIKERHSFQDIRNILCKLSGLKHDTAEYRSLIERLLLRPNFIIEFIRYSAHQISEEILGSKELRILCLRDPFTSFTRDRIITLESLFLFLLCLAGGDLNREVYEFFKYKFEIPTASAMVQRRELLLPEGEKYFFDRMTEILRDLFGDLSDDPKFPFDIYAADGTDINIALNPNSDTHVETSHSDGWNQYHLNLLYDIRRRLFVKGVIQPKHEIHETRAIADMIRQTHFTRWSLLTGDRGYGSLNLFETVHRTPNLDYLIRVKEDFINEIKNLPLGELDTDIQLHIITTQRKSDKERIARGEAKYLSGVSKFGKYKKSQSWNYETEHDMTLRVVRFSLSSGNWETLITSLPRDKFPAEDLKEIYRFRWQIELSVRHLKYDTHLAQMHCRLEPLAQQEIWAKMTMHNIVSGVMYIAEKRDAEKPEKETKHELKVNRRFAAHVITDCLKNETQNELDIVNEILRHKAPVRKGRSFKRDMKGIGFYSFLYRS